MDNFHAISITHKNADLHFIGSLLPECAHSDNSIHVNISRLKDSFNFDEVFFLNTCNRLLLIYIAETPVQNIQTLFAALNPEMFLDNKQVEQFDIYEGIEVVEHLFNVCSGLDSMVVGEHEILGQVKKAYQNSRANNWIGDNLRILFEYAIAYAKQIYHQTDIGKHTVSVVALAVEKLRIIHNPEDQRVLIVGAGESIQKTSRLLLKMGFNKVIFFNRTLEKAERIAEQFEEGKAFQLTELENYNKGFDILISCIDQKPDFINQCLFEKLINKCDKKKLLIDLAIPNNIDKSIANQHDIDIVDIESLKVKAKDNLAKRKLSLTDAEALIDEQLEEFTIIFQKRQLERALSDIPTKMKKIKNHALETVFEKDLRKADDETRALVEKVLSYVEKKYISIPMTIARDALFEKIDSK